MNTDALLSRRNLYVALTILAIAFVALLWMLLSLKSQSKPPAHTTVAGVTPQLLLYGPGVGSAPLFKGPMGAAFGSDGRLYVADTGNNRIVAFDRDGKYLFQFGGLGVAKPAAGGTFSWKPGLFNYPTDVAVDESGTVYVADFNNDQIQQFTADGVFIRAFPDRARKVGKGSSGEGGGIAVTSLTAGSGKVYATDRYQVVEFDTSGKFIRQFGLPGTGKSGFDHPNGITTLGSSVVVSDSNNNRVMNMGAGTKALWTVGRPLGYRPTMQAVTLQLPRGITDIGNGSLLVADALASKLIQISQDGRVSATYGERGGAAGEFNMPTDVSSGPGGLLAIADKGNNRVQVVLLSR